MPAPPNTVSPSIGAWIWTNPFGDYPATPWNISTNTEIDYYRFFANATGTFSITVSGGTLDSILRVYDANGNPLTNAIDLQFDGGTETASVSLTEGQWCIIGVGGFNGDVGSYNLAINGPTPFQNVISTPGPTYVGSYTGGSISPAGDIDWFQLTAPSGATSLNVSVDAVTSSLDTVVQVLNASGSPVGSVINNAGAGGTDVGANISVVGGQTYWVGVTSFAGSGTYNLSVDFNPDQAGAADLLIDNLTPVGASVAAGTGISLGATIRNAGSASAAASSARFYLSTDATLDAGDTVLTTLPTGALTVGASTTIGLSVPISGTLAPGQYYLIVAADYNDVVPESNNNNNVFATPITITSQALPDLLIDNLTPVNATVAAGAGLSLDAIVRNAGTGSTGAFTTRFYISHDNTLDAGDQVLSAITSGSLSTSQSTTLGQSVLVPTNLLPGDYYLGVWADYNGQVSETNDNNNSYLVPIHISNGNIATGTVTTHEATPQSSPVTLSRVGTTAPIDPNLPTWIIIHGKDETPATLSAITQDALNAGYQVLTLDWQVGAGAGFHGEYYIPEVSQWLATALAAYGFGASSGTSNNVNIIGHSWGAVIAGQTAEDFLAGTGHVVGSIIALDPADDADALGGDPAYDTSSVDFAAYSHNSWAFLSSELGSSVSAGTADAAFAVRIDGDDWLSIDAHVDIIAVMAAAFGRNNAGTAGPLTASFGLDDAISGAHFWTNNAFTVDPFDGTATFQTGPFEGVLLTFGASGGFIPYALNYSSGGAPNTAYEFIAPEITVSGNGVAIGDGDSSSSTADATDFGSVLQGGAAVQHTFTVTNTGNAALTTSGLSLPSGFSLVEGLSASIAPGASDTFTVQLNTSILGSFGGQITFTNNDSNESPFNFSITGNVNASATPEIAVSGNGVDIGDGDTTPSIGDATDFGAVLQSGAAVTRTFTVTNTGNAALTTSGLSLPSGFSLVEGLSASIAPGASDTFTVQLNTSTLGSFGGQISFATNDSNENPFNFNIAGSVNASAAPEIAVSCNNVNIVDDDSSPSILDFTDFGAAAQGGAALTRTFTVTNTGNSALTTSGLSLPSGFSLVEGLSPSIAPGDSDTFTVQLSTSVLGTFGGQISFATSDSDENPFNFNITGTVANASTLPDLAVTNLTTNVNSGPPGTEITVSCTVGNSGPATANASLTNVYWSTDSTIDNTDTLIASINMASILSGHSVGLNVILDLPNVAPGVYYIGIAADGTQQITETNESNNLSNVIQITVSPPSPPDFYVNTISGLPASMTAGDSASLFYYMGNAGGVVAPASTVGIYLSTDNVITTSDLLLTTDAVGAIAANTQLPVINVPFTLPQDLASGVYYVGVIVDYSNAIVETNENNNVSVVMQLPITSLFTEGSDSVVLTAPSLQIHALGGDDQITGSSGADGIYGEAGNDTITGGLGADYLNGGSGIDTANYASASTSDGWHRNLDGSWTISAGAEGTDTLNGVEFAHFTDRDVFLARASETFTGDGASDLFLRNSAGTLSVWSLNGASITGAGAGSITAAWSTLGYGDLNGDGRDDILWRDTSGNVALWEMNGAAVTSIGLGNVSTSWNVAGVGDLNGDLTDDVLWRNSAGDMSIWFQDSSGGHTSASLGNVDPSWVIEAFGDFNGDGKQDFLWRNTVSGDMSLWFMNGTSVTGGQFAHVGQPWQVEGTGDFNGDGRDDVVWRNSVTGDMSIWMMNGQTLVSQPGYSIGVDWHIAAIGDYNGDGKDDLIWRNDNGTLVEWLMNGGAITSSLSPGSLDPDWIINPGG